MKKKILLGIFIGGLISLLSHNICFADTFDIETADDLLEIQTTSSENYSGDTINLLNDIDLTGKTYTPIGSSSYPFAGTFEGNGHTISGLSITGTTTYRGLLGYISATAVVQNVIVSGSVAGGNYTGGLVGYSLGTIQNCGVNVNVSAATSTSRVGGIVGYNGGSILKSYHNGTVSGGSMLGGIVGQNASSKTIQNVYNIGTVTGYDTTSYGYIGGLVGYNQGTLTNGYQVGTVSNQYSSRANYKGGVVGRNTATVTNTYYASTGSSRGIYAGTNSGSVTGVAESKTEDALKASGMPTTLNASQSPVMWAQDLYSDNDGYPILSWQSYTIDFDTTITATMTSSGASATATVTNANGYTIQKYEFYVNNVLKDTITTSALTATSTALGSIVFGDASNIKVVVTASSDKTSRAVTTLTNSYIYTDADLRSFATKVNAGTTYSGQTIQVMADINLGNVTFTPIGGTTYQFAGTFEGNNHTISGLSITGSSQYSALFGKTASTTVLQNFTVSGSVQGGYYTAGVVGYNLGTINNVTSNVAVSAYSSSYTYYGGIIGYSSGGNISNCTNTGTITGGYYIGGIVGYFATGNISNATNSGIVTTPYGNFGYDADDNFEVYDLNVGGIVGFASGVTITNSHNTANVSATHANYAQSVGGMVGNMYNSSITGSYNTGSVSTSYDNLGGIVGKATGTATINNVYNTGNVTNSKSDYTGGIVGYTSSAINIQNSHNEGTISGPYYIGGISGAIVNNNSSIENVYNEGEINGTSDAGGLVGQLYGAISKSYNTGNVTTTSYRVGGITGIMSGSITTLMNVYNTGTITGAYANTSSEIGGLVGRMYINNSTVYIKNSYNAGNVVNNGNAAYKGGIVGYRSGTSNIIENCYYLSGTADKGVYTGTDAGTAKTSEQLASNYMVILLNGSQSPLVWTRNASLNNGYPIFGDGASSGAIVVSVNAPVSAGTVNATANVTDAGGHTISSYEFYVNGALRDTVTTSNLTATSSFNAAFGDFSIIAIAIASDGAMGMNSTTASSLYIFDNTDMRTFATNVNAGTTYSGQTIQVMADINLGNTAFTPIGGTTYQFAGTFEGNSHTISGLSITGTNQYSGLFGKTASTATLQNFTVSGSVAGGNYTAGLVGYNLGTINNCNGNCTINISTSYNYAGVIAGYSEGNITNCTSAGSVTGANYVGGTIGQIQSGTVSDCSNSATVQGSTYAGGISGVAGAASILTKLSNSGNITTSSYFVGGIVGRGTGASISICYNTGDITSTGSYDVGGIAGAITTSATVTNVYNVGTISGKYNNLASYIGGVVGCNDASTISNAYNAGTVTNTGNATYVGGVIGGNWNSSAINTNCYYLLSKTAKGIYYLNGATDNTVSKTEVTLATDETKNLLNASQDPVVWYRSNSLNSGYPILRKEAGSFSYAITVITKTYGDEAFTNPLTYTGDGAVTYVSSDTNVATVDANGQVTICGVGNITITATVAEGEVYAYANDTAMYWLNILPSASPTGTITITPQRTIEGAKHTNSRTVTVTVTASDDVTPTNELMIALINENDISTTTNNNIQWRAYTSSPITWQLSEGDGVKRVYLIIKDEEGNQTMYLSD